MPEVDNTLCTIELQLNEPKILVDDLRKLDMEAERNVDLNDEEMIADVTNDQEPENADGIQEAPRSLTVSCDTVMLVTDTLLSVG